MKLRNQAAVVPYNIERSLIVTRERKLYRNDTILGLVAIHKRFLVPI